MSNNTSVIEISKSALINNLNFIRGLFGEEIKVSAVIKGNAYGHDIKNFVRLAEECGINHFSVFSSDEALRTLKSAKKKNNIMIMGYIDNYELEWAIQNGIEFYIFELERLEQALKISKKLNKPAKLHIEVETGLNRTGLLYYELKKAVNILKENQEHLSFEGLCTHYAGAESIANYPRIKKQIKVFNTHYKNIIKHGLKPKLRHTACSAASVSYPETRMDMVRIGIMLYGFWPSKETYLYYIMDNNKDIEDPLRRLITWKSHVMTVKEIKRGEFIGYSTNYLAQEDMKIAIVPVGYSTGFSRSLSNQGRVLINGMKASVIGIVNMNMVTVNVTDMPDVKKGDEVVIIGNQGSQSISVSSFSDFTDQVNYELLARLPWNIPRKIVD